MRGIVRCDHCGAPHRRVAASTRFRCEWCGGDNRIDVSFLVEELLFAADERTRSPLVRVEEALGRRGIRRASISASPARWTGIWQIVNEDGEDFVSPVSTGDVGERLLKELPVGALRSPGDDPPAWVGDLPERPAPGRDAASVVEAARATFRDADAKVSLVRLVWLAIQEFDLQVEGEHFCAVQILGTDRVLFDRVPGIATAPPAVGARMWSWAAFAAGAFMLGLSVGDPSKRAIVEFTWAVAGVAVWSLLRNRRPGVSS